MTIEEVTFSTLTKPIQVRLSEIALIAYNYIQSTGEGAWCQLNQVLLDQFKLLDFSEFAHSLPLVETYHRIPYELVKNKLTVVMFVFQSDFSEKAAVLMHFYSQPFPNCKVYNWSQVLNPKINAREHKQTPPHEHGAKCYSIIAWADKGVEVVEDQFEKTTHEQIKLVRRIPRPVNSCEFDEGGQGLIHSISVLF